MTDFVDGDRYEDHKGRTFTLRREERYYDDGSTAIWAFYDDGEIAGPFAAEGFGGPDGGEVTRIGRGQSGAVFDAEEVLKKTVNANGQIYLGRDLEGKTVRVAYEIIDGE